MRSDIRPRCEIRLGCARLQSARKRCVPIPDRKCSATLGPAEADMLQNLYAFMLLWTAGTTSVRVSILLFYWRVFSVPTFRKAVLVAGGIVLSAGTAFLLIFAFQCSPPSHFWNTATDGTCIDQLAFYLSGGAINLLQDVMILIMPMPVLWHLKATVPRKLALCFIFALGGFVCITSIIRLFTIKQIDPTDFTCK